MSSSAITEKVRNAGKFGKAKRGGGRHFSRDLSRLNSDGEAPGAGSDDSSSEESSSEEEEDTQPQNGQLPPIADSDSETEGLSRNLNASKLGNDSAPSSSANKFGNTAASTRPKLTAEEVAEARKARKAGAKKGGAAKEKKVGSGSEEESEAEENDNKKQGRSMKVSDLASAPREMSRREREQKEKAAAADRYAKMHAAGKTDEAKSDLARLAAIRKERAAAAERRKAETEAAAAASAAALEKSGKKGALRR